MNTEIPKDRIRWIGVRGLDPVGRVFEYEGRYFRAIRPERADFVRGLFSKGIPQRLAERGLLIGAEEAPVSVEGFAFVLAHPTVPFETRAHEWPRTLLRDAARVWLELNLALLPEGLGLIDAHGANFGQIGACRPVWLDFGSIAPLEKSNTGFAEFRAHFLHPLRLLYAKSATGSLVRAALRHGGITDDAAAQLIPRTFRPAAAFAGWRAARSPDRNVRREHSLRDWLGMLSDDLPPPRTFWQSYQSGASLPPDYASLPARKATFQRLLRELKPQSVIDLAANEGYFSFMAARETGADTLAVDFDEGAADSLYRQARASNIAMSVTCACADVFEPRRERTAPDLALAPALTHHLTLTQRFPWSAVAAAFARNTTSALITEFMPHGLGVKKQGQIPEWYRLENFRDALSVHFDSVEIVDYPADPAASPRTIILARGRRSN